LLLCFTNPRVKKMGARQAEGLQPRSRRAPQESDPGRVPRICPFPGGYFWAGLFFPFVFLHFIVQFQILGRGDVRSQEKGRKPKKTFYYRNTKRKKREKNQWGLWSNSCGARRLWG